MGIITILLYFLFPALIIVLSTKYPIINKIGIVVFSYAGGFLMAFTNIIPESIEGPDGAQMVLFILCILVGVPMVLFSENVVKWTRMAKYTFISLLLGVVSVVILVIAGFFVFRERIPDVWRISGMMIGVYTGGSANMMAIAASVGVDEEMIVLTNTVEMVIGAIILLFLITGAKPLFGLFLKPYKFKGDLNQPDLDVKDFESYEGFFQRSSIPDMLKAFGIALVIAGAGFGLMFFVFGLNDTGFTVAVLTVTTLGLLVSLIPAVHRMKRSFQLGMYFIYIFCMIVASQADLAFLFSPEAAGLVLNIFLFISFVMVGSLVIHSLLSKIFGISVDEFVITSTALADSPPFVPVVAAAMRNKEVVVPGMIVGVVGYAIGNYLGVAIAYLLR
jgi:uncharacterized membrane protein